MIAGITGWGDKGLEAKRDKSKAVLKHGTVDYRKMVDRKIFCHEKHEKRRKGTKIQAVGFARAKRRPK